MLGLVGGSYAFPTFVWWWKFVSLNSTEVVSFHRLSTLDMSFCLTSLCLLGLIFVFHLSCSRPFDHPGHVFTRLGNVLLSLSACPSFNLLILLSLLFILLIMSFYLPLTLSCPSAHFTFSSPFYPNSRCASKTCSSFESYILISVLITSLGLFVCNSGYQRWEL